MLEHRNNNSALWHLLFNKRKINRNTHTWPRWQFRIIYRFPCRFIVHNHPYNTKMSLLLGIHNCRIWPTKFHELSVCFSNIILDIIEVSSSPNMAEVKCPVSSMVNFSQYANGMPMYFRHISVYNTNVGNKLPKHITFKPNKMNIIHPNSFLAANIQDNLNLESQLHENNEWT